MSEFVPLLTRGKERSIDANLVAQGIFPASFLKGYLTALEWLLPEQEEGDETPETTGFAPETLKKIAKECETFENDNAEDLAHYAEGYTPKQGYSVYECAGHDFFLSREGHGSGFSDRGKHPCFERLEKAASKYRESSPYIGDDSLVYVT